MGVSHFCLLTYPLVWLFCCHFILQYFLKICINMHFTFYYVMLSFLKITLDINLWLIAGSSLIYFGLPVSHFQSFGNCSLSVFWLCVSASQASWWELASRALPVCQALCQVPHSPERWAGTITLPPRGHGASE